MQYTIRIFIIANLLGLAGLTAFAAPLDRATVAADYAKREEAFWRRIARDEPYPTLGSRAVFTYAMALCESRQQPERLARLFDLGAQMQDRDPASNTYGNLWWTWKHGKVTDQNAVEFCIQDALTLWLRHRDWLPPDARAKLAEILRFAVEGCLRHRVPTDYTNIAILNAGNLIVLGETLDRPDAAEEGYRRLEALCLWTWQFGTHEFVSPTYYSPDLNGLMFIRQFARQARGQAQAKALFDLLWTDIALNWHVPSGRLAGPHSRSYDYLRGHGPVDGHLMLRGWMEPKTTEPFEFVHSAMFEFAPPDKLRERSNETYPRIVRQRWGIGPTEARTHAVYPDVTLGACGAIYAAARQDMPLTVDLPGERDAVRCYFIPDGRQDPYGKWRYETGAAGHAKALHLTPFFAAAQHDKDALALVVYRPEDLKMPEVFNVQSHFVVRRTEEIWCGGRKVVVPRGVSDEAGRVLVKAEEPLVFRYGTATVGLKTLAARRQDGSPSRIALVDDGNSFGALRVTVDHRSEEKTVEPLAVFWVRIGSGLKDDAAFEAWRSDFDKARGDAAIGADKVVCSVPAVAGRVRVAASRPFGTGGRVVLDPKPYGGVLEVNGQEVGRPLLAAVEPIASYNGPTPDRPLAVPAEGLSWTAARGLVLAGMTVTQEEQSGIRYVTQPREDGNRRIPGSLFVPLRIASAGTYYLWGRVQAPDPQADSLYVRITGENIDVPRTAWHLRVGDDWNWQPVGFDKLGVPTPLKLPAGDCLLQLQTREAGVKLERLLLTPDATPQLP